MFLFRHGLCFAATFLLGSFTRVSSRLSRDDNPPLQQALLKDWFSAIPIAPGCKNGGDLSVTEVTFDFTPTTFYFDEAHAEHEEHVFLLEMSSPSLDNPNRTWTFRVGTGGQTYSFVGAYGEVVPPQHHHDAPWIDEVWQTVSVDTRVPRAPNCYDIHQAGTYQRDGLPRPFYSPTLSVHCESNYCMVASYGQHAHIPTHHSNTIFYLTRFANCGEGVLETTSMIYNSKFSAFDPEEQPPHLVNHLVVPWGGVRTSSLKDLIFTEPGSDGEKDVWKVQKPIAGFAEGKAVKLDTSAGYSIFAQSVKKMDEEGIAEFEMPSVVEEAEEDEELNDGTPSSGANATDDTCEAVESTPAPKGRGKGKGRARGKGQGQGIGKRRQTRKLSVRPAKKGAVRDLNRPNTDGRPTYQMRIQPTVDMLSGNSAGPFHFYNPATEKGFVVDSILNWNLRGGMNFISRDSVEDINAALQQGKELQVSYHNEGTRNDDNLGLSYVHGQNQRRRGSERRLPLPALIRYGIAGQGTRDFTVFSLINKDTVQPGQLWYKRQYMISDSLAELEASSKLWNRMVIKHKLIEEEVSEMKATDIGIYASSDGGTIGASVDGSCQGSLVCSGTTTPTETNTHFLFSISCGDDQTYVGAKAYYFSPEVDDKDKRRLHECKGHDKGVVPDIKLLGFFELGACDAVSEAKYDPSFCSAGAGSDEL